MWGAFICGFVCGVFLLKAWQVLGRKIGHKQLSDKDFERGLASITTPEEEEAIRECRRNRV